MINLLISGALGRMGKKVYEACKTSDGISPVCGVDRFEDLSNKDFPVYSCFAQVKEKIDVIIDFSAPANLPRILDFCLANGTPAVLCATGYSDEDVNAVKKASQKVVLTPGRKLEVL